MNDFVYEDFSRQPSITYLVGSTGGGKSTIIKSLISDERRVIVWDPTNEYWQFCDAVCTTPGALKEQLIKNAQGFKRIAYVPTLMGDFDFFCRAAWSWSNCTVIAEELADVTSAGKAPEAWGVLIRRGRHRGLKIIATSQRPQEADKTILGNITELYICRLSNVNDRRYLSKATGVDCEKLDTLERYHFIRLNALGEVKTGKTQI